MNIQIRKKKVKVEQHNSRPDVSSASSPMRSKGREDEASDGDRKLTRTRDKNSSPSSKTPPRRSLCSLTGCLSPLQLRQASYASGGDGGDAPSPSSLSLPLCVCLSLSFSLFRWERGKRYAANQRAMVYHEEEKTLSVAILRVMEGGHASLEILIILSNYSRMECAPSPKRSIKYGD